MTKVVEGNNSSQALSAVLIVNLGSPEQLTTKAIRQFLSQFLRDWRVVGLPKIIWYPILFGIILPLRAPRLLRKYRQIWHASKQSPLHYYSQEQTMLLQQQLGNNYLVRYAYCYGSASIARNLAFLQEKAVAELIVLPLYPQYSSSTTAPVFDQVAHYYQKQYRLPSIYFISGFARHPLYIAALKQQVLEHWQQQGRGECLLVSFHSIPETLVDQGDIYVSECQATYQLLCQALDLRPDREAKICFQSKFGKAKWVEPATDATIVAQAQAKLSIIDVICPGFVSDCLETLEEVAIQYHELFLAHGGQDLRFIRSLNATPSLITVLAALIQSRGKE